MDRANGTLAILIEGTAVENRAAGASYARHQRGCAEPQPEDPCEM